MVAGEPVEEEILVVEVKNALVQETALVLVEEMVGVMEVVEKSQVVKVVAAEAVVKAMLISMRMKECQTLTVIQMEENFSWKRKK